MRRPDVPGDGVSKSSAIAGQARCHVHASRQAIFAL